MQSNLVRPLSFRSRAPIGTAPGSPNGSDAALQRSRLEQAFVDFYNGLFDLACAATDEARHAHYLGLLRETKARERAIIESVCADAGMWTAADEAPVLRRLKDAVVRRCETLPMEAGERALLESVLERHLFGPVDRASSGDASRRLRAEARGGTAHGAGASRVPAEDERANLARVVARLRAGGLQMPEFDGPAVTPQHPQAEPTHRGDARRVSTRWTRTSTVLLGLALLLFCLSPLYDMLFATVSGVLAGKPAARTESIVVKTDARAASATVVEPSSPVPAPVLPEPTVTATPMAAAAAPDPLPVPENSAIADGLATAPAAVADERLEIQVQYLLRRGDAALARLQLTEPYADSAAANYAAVLAIDAENAQARQGLERITTAYIGLARDALGRGNDAYARDLLVRARTVQPETEALQQLEQEIDGAASVPGR